MRKKLATFAMTALLVTPSMAVAEPIMMPSDEEIQPGIMQNGQSATEELAGSETIEAKIVEFDGDRLVAKVDNGQGLVFLVDDSIDYDNLAVGDKLELRLDHQASRAVILNVFPENEEPAS